MRFLSLKERFILKKMISKYFFLVLFIWGCQKDLLDSEKADFQSKCMNSPTLNNVSDNDEVRESFCHCVLDNISKIGLDYEEFLRKSKTDDTILNGCVDQKSSNSKNIK